MIIKVCGITEVVNGQDVCALGADMVGINFYSSSPRFAEEPDPLRDLSSTRVGVFVDASRETIERAVVNGELSMVQLHGHEPEEEVRRISAQIPVIKAFPASPATLASGWRGYECCRYFLFDTASAGFGGSGQQFDWRWLDEYKGDVPFLLSGGIGPDDVGRILGLRHPAFAGIDVNSRFEIRPGIKNIALLASFINALQTGGKDNEQGHQRIGK